MHLTPIGAAHNGIMENGRTVTWEDVVSEVVLDARYAEALDGIEEFSHIWVLFWLHKAEDRSAMKHRPMGFEELPEVGLFATRSPNRPNPIAIRVVRLLERKGNALKVRGLDAFNGSPVLDIKPYVPYVDAFPEASAGWLSGLRPEEPDHFFPKKSP